MKKNRLTDRDRELGMGCRITRRDFLNGVALTAGATILPSCGKETPSPQVHAAVPATAEYYPPALLGLRGNHEGSFEVAHEMRDGAFWQKAGTPVETGESYDLVVVGGGISGLSAAYYFQQQAGPQARILVLDNHDDFGGHAKRNEFHVDGRMILGFGGTFSIDSPAKYSAVAKKMITDLGIDVSRWQSAVDFKVYGSQGLQPAIFFDKETFGVDRLVPVPLFGFWADSEDENGKIAENWKSFVAAAPISEAAKADWIRLYTQKIDYLPGLTSKQKKAKLARMNYADFLTKTAKMDPDIAKVMQSRAQGLFGLGIDAVPAQDAWGLQMPGFQGMKLDPSFGPGMNRDAMEEDDGGDAYFFHFPDGNASIARMLVRKLIPASIPGNTMDDIVTAKCNYARLDESSSPVRVRLNSTVVRVKHAGDPATASEVDVAYVRDKKLQNVKAKNVVLACWNAVIPYICPELPAKQQEDLSYETKVPLLYTNVVISNWHSFVKAGLRDAYCPGSFHSYVTLDMPVNIGNYKCSQAPDQSIVVHMMRTPCSPGIPARQQHRAGRLELFNTKFETFERNIRDQLARMLGPSGFDPARDIRAIIVNRWAHGYAYQYNSLFDDFWLEGKETPCERGRKPFGRLAIANADAGAYAYTDCAIDQAYRAVNEILKKA